LIPKVLHYCFGISSDAPLLNRLTRDRRHPWSLVHYVCLRSAVERFKPKDVLFYCEHEPTGPWWELTRPLVTVRTIEAPREVFGNPLLHGAHRADVVRLERLLSVGGVYLDTDVFVHSSFDPLLANVTVLGEERVDGRVVGLCNAVILAEAEAPFLRRWHSMYRGFRSKGHDSYWDEHSVRIPYQLSQKHPNEVTVLPHTAFFWPTFKPEDLALIFDSVQSIDLSRAYATHLWETPAWARYLEHLTPRRVRSVHTNFHYWARPLIETLPDNYGAPNAIAYVVHRARRTARRVRSVIQNKGLR
jgi:hypothetical protein